MAEECWKNQCGKDMHKVFLTSKKSQESQNLQKLWLVKYCSTDLISIKFKEL